MQTETICACQLFINRNFMKIFSKGEHMASKKNCTEVARQALLKYLKSLYEQDPSGEKFLPQIRSEYHRRKTS